MSSIFNTTRTAKASGELTSSEYAKITLGGVVSLGQSVTGGYERQISTVFEIGNPNIYWIGGHEQGTLSISRLVGKNGFFHAIEPGACGEISPVGVDLVGGQCSSGGSGLTFEDAMVQGLTWNITSGALEITEGVSLRFATLSRSGASISTIAG